MASRRNLVGSVALAACLCTAVAPAYAADPQAGAPAAGQVALAAPEAGTPSAPSADVQAGTVKPTDAAPDPAKIAAGREVFNGTCAHCHGPDAIQSERRINLRLLQHRYAEKMDEVFHYTVTHGRPDKGMPNWSGVFTEDDFANILAYLHTVQTSD